MVRHEQLALKFLGVEGGEAKFEFHCEGCGSYVLRASGEPGDMAMLHCDGCDAWVGRLGAIKVQCSLIAMEHGVPVKLPALANPVDPADYDEFFQKS